MYDIWLNQNVTTDFAEVFKRRCLDIEIQSWRESVSSFGALRLYRLLKFDLEYKPYLNLNLSKTVKNMYSRIRCGLLKVGVNTGRWEGVPYLERICTFCNMNVIEDEIHFVFACPVWSGFRTQLSSYNFFRANNCERVFCSDDPRFIRDLCSFVSRALAFREELGQP